MPVRRAERTMVAQLDAIASQDYEGPFELIVAVNRRDPSAAIAERWLAEQGPGRVVDVYAPGAGHARNRGVAASGGDLLAFCDADDVVTQGWLSALVAAAGEADVVTGPHSVELLNNETVRACQRVWPLDRPLHDFLPIASTSNCAVWRSVFEALGGFEEQRYAAGEDVAFSWRAQLRGYRLAVAGAALVHKRFRRNRPAIAPQYFHYGMGDAWLYSRFGRLGMPRRSPREALREWRAIARGLPSEAGEPGRWGRVLQMAALSCGRAAGSLRFRALYL